MPADLQLPLKAFTGVGPGNIAMTELQLDRDYHTIALKATATGETDFADIVEKVDVVVNGVTVRSLTPAQLRRLNGVNGAIYNPDDALMVYVHFREDWLWNALGADTLTLHASGVRNARIEVSIKSGVTNVALSGYYTGQLKDGSVSAETNIIRHVKAFDLTFGASGETSFRNLPFAGLVRRIFVFTPANVVARAKFKVSETEIFNLTKAQEGSMLKLNSFVPDNNGFVLGWDFTQKPGDGLPGRELRESELILEVTAPGTYRALVEYFAPIPA